MTTFKTMLVLSCLGITSTTYGGPRDDAAQLLNRPTQGDKFKSHVLRGHLNEKWLRKHLLEQENNSSSVFLALGNASQSDWSEERVQETTSLVKGLRSKGYRIVYDRKSRILAKIIKDHVDVRYRFGIGGYSEVDTARAVSIQNPWLRLSLLLSFEKIIVSSDSPLGTALILEGMLNRREGVGSGKTFEIFSFDIDSDSHFEDLGKWQRLLNNGISTYDPSKESHVGTQPQVTLQTQSPSRTTWTAWISSLVPSFISQAESLPAKTSNSKTASVEPEAPRLLESFGIWYKMFPKTLRTAAELLAELKDCRLAAPFRPYSGEGYLEELNDHEVNQALAFAEDFSTYSRENLNHARTDLKSLQLLPAAAVLFGSGQGSSVYQPLVEVAVRVLSQRKVSMTTGGCGGFMAVANQVAFEMGVPSIGIPHGARQTQCHSGSRNQTLTLQVRDYVERIPFLLFGKKVVLIAPGGPGTMKEIATTLVQASQEIDPEKIPHLVFLDRDYYGGLVQWFQNLQLPEHLIQKIHLVHSEKEMENLCDRIELGET